MLKVINFKEYFRTNYVLLRIAGIWIGESSEIKPNWYKYYSFSAFIVLLTFNLSLFIKCIISESIKDFASVGYVACATAVTVLKRILLLNNKNYLVALIKEFNNKNFQIKDFEELEITEKKLHEFTIVRRGLQALFWLALFLIIMSPMIRKTEQGLLFPGWYPFDVTSLRGYQVAYCHQVISAVFMGTSSTYTDFLVGANCTFVGLQCSLLSIRLKNIGNDGIEVRKSLMNCINHHHNILRLV